MQMVIWFQDKEYSYTDMWIVERPDFTPEGYPVYSRLFVCPCCHEVWAKVIREDQSPARPEMVSCGEMSTCQWTDELTAMVPGSLLDYGVTLPGMIDFDLLDILPEPLLRREFDLTLKALL